MLQKFQMVVSSRWSQTILQQRRVKLLYLLACNLVQTFATKLGINTKVVKLRITFPAAFTRLHVWQVVVVVEVTQRDYFLDRLFFPSRIGTQSNFRLEFAGFLARFR